MRGAGDGSSAVRGRRALALLGVLAVGLVSACQPAAPGPHAAIGPASPAGPGLVAAPAHERPDETEPERRTIDIVGDSITVQSFWNRDAQWRAAGVGLGPEYDLVMDAWAGYTFAHVEDRELARVVDPAAPRPDVLVIALGTNNTSTWLGGTGWQVDDEKSFRGLLNTPRASTCVVVSLPAIGAAGDPGAKVEFAKARVAMARIAHERPNTVVIDWNDVISAHPDILGSDGVHLAGDALAAEDQLGNPDAGDAYGAHLWGGVAQCASQAVTH